MKKQKKNITADIETARKELHQAGELFLSALRRFKGIVAAIDQAVPPATTKKPATKKKASPAKTPVKKAPKAPAPKEPAEVSPGAVKRRTPASVRLTPQEITLNVGSSAVKSLAEREAREFLNTPNVFWNRQAQFPDPKRYGVQPRVIHARAVERRDPKFTRAPWTVNLTIAIEGDTKKAESWGLGVYSKNKGDQE